jgi:hypothetical protein
MPDPTTLAAVASSAVALIAPLLQKALEKGAEELGKSAAGRLLAKLTERLNHRGAREALEDLENAPADPAAQGALNMQLRKALAVDPDLVTFLRQWLDEAKSTAAVSQIANVHGDHNKLTQITGSGNQVD